MPQLCLMRTRVRQEELTACRIPSLFTSQLKGRHFWDPSVGCFLCKVRLWKCISGSHWATFAAFIKLVRNERWVAGIMIRGENCCEAFQPFKEEGPAHWGPQHWREAAGLLPPPKNWSAMFWGGTDQPQCSTLSVLHSAVAQIPKCPPMNKQNQRRVWAPLPALWLSGAGSSNTLAHDSDVWKASVWRV